MKVPLSWLREYCAPDITLDQLERALTISGTKVEAIHHHGLQNAEHAVIGRVETRERHPDADRLSVCTVDVGEDEPATIVCGAPNVAAGQTVVVARPGTVMPNGMKIKKAKLRGVPSEGMICSASELGLSAESDGILALEAPMPGADAAPGTPAAGLLPISEPVIEFEITPNRPDCLGVYGIAREVHASTGAPLEAPPWADDPGAETGDAIDGVTITIDAPDLCPRFTARRFENVTIGPSPLWLQARLTAAGQRPINNVVDITNFVMLLTGQPLHAFDLGRVAGGRLTVRRATEGERMTTLDGQERTLDDQMLLIEDGEGPTSIAGVMGGLRSEVEPQTTSVLMEAANWNGPNIHRTAQKLALRSEASARFAKGLAPEQALDGLALATRLMLELTGAEQVGGTIDAGPFADSPTAPVVVELRDNRVTELLGMAIDRGQQRHRLEALGFGVEETGDGFAVTVPPFRREDVTREADLIEEVGRFDLDRLPATLPKRRGAAGKLSPEQHARRRAVDALVDRGAYEVVGWSFTSPAVADRLRLPAGHPLRSFVTLENPMSEEQSVLRTTLLGSLLDVAAGNCRRGRTDLSLCEQGAVYRAASGERPEVRGANFQSSGARSASEDERRGPGGRSEVRGANFQSSGARSASEDERRGLGYLACGRLTPRSWDGDDRRAGFFSAKAMLTAVMGALRVEWSVEPREEPFLHPGRSASVVVAGEVVGWLGEIHPLVTREWDVPEGAATFVIDIDRVTAEAVHVPVYRDVPAFPSVNQDLAVVVPDELSAADVLDTIKTAGGKLLGDVRLFDVYRGEQVGEGRASLALALTYQAPDRTLTDEEIVPVREKIVAALAGKGAELRG